MARTITPLTATQIKQAKPKEKDYKLSDGRGLYLLVTKRSTKLWRLKYKFDGKEKLLSLGAYPDISLSHIWTHYEKQIRDAMKNCFREPDMAIDLHDAVYSREEVDMQVLEQAVLEATGFKMKISH